jgi:8-amino-7-oxononanoate synthase
VHLDHLPGSFFGPSNLVDLLQHRALHQAQDRAFTYLVDGENEQIQWTNAQLAERARMIAAKLQSMGLAGERALLLYPAGLDFIAAFFGCLYAGVVAVPAYPPRRNRSLARIQSIVDDAQARVALTTAPVFERIVPHLDQTPELKKVSWVATDELPLEMASDWREPDVHGDTLAFLQYTSGSTGIPKGVVLTHANLMHNSALIAYAFEHTRSGAGVFWLPSYHDMGLIGGILQPLYIGQTSMLFSPMSFLQRPFRWLQAISRYRFTISGGPNFAYDLCVDKVTPEQLATLDLSSWRLAFNGAEPVRAATLERFATKFEPCGFRPEAFYPCYGMAESTLIITGGFKSALPVVRSFDSKALENNQVVDAVGDEEGAQEIVGCGSILLDQKLAIVDPQTLIRVADDQVGEVWVSGPSVAQGYWNRPEQTEQIFRAYLQDTGEGPFLRTGDLGFLKDGELFITGRLKDLMIIRGRNYYPQDIEQTAGKSHPRLRVGQAAAFTVEIDGRQRMVLVHEVERRQNRELDPVFEAIRHEVAAEHELPVDVIVLIKAGSIPKTSSGKIQRHAARQEYLDGTLEIVAQWRAGVDALPSAEAGAHETHAHHSGETYRPAPRTNGAAILSPAPATADIVMAHVRRVAKERAGGMTLDSSIVELGLDSLERMEIAAGLEEQFGGRFPEEVLSQIETPREVATAVDRYLGHGAAPVHRAPVGEIPAAYYQFDQFPEYLKLKHLREEVRNSGLRDPYFKVHDGVIADTTTIGGRKLVSFSSYNYLGMSGDPKVGAATKKAVDRFGTSVSASRLVSGEKTIHREMEEVIAQFIGAEACITFVGGHAANETTLGHMFGPGDLILHDALAHNSLMQGAMLSGARRRPFPHNNWQALDELLVELRRTYRRVVIVIEGVYSMDGDFPDLPRFMEIKRKHQALLYIDEAHSLGVMGKTGRGICEHYGVNPREVDIMMGTLSKALGSCGGAIVGDRALIEYLKYTAPGFVFANGMTPANVAAALTAIQVLEAEPERVTRLHERAELFLSLARERGLNTGNSHSTPVIPVILGSSIDSLRLSEVLFERGINVQPILHPAVEEKAARLRFFITTRHTEKQIRDTVDAVTEELEKINPRYLKQGVALS